MSKLAIITGGTRGIGAAISIALKEQGFTVIANYHNNHEAANKFAAATNIKIKNWNVANYDECIKTVQIIEAEFNKPVSILINNAGITKDSMLHKMSKADWQDVININLTSCFNMCSAVINQMRNQNYGRIINISSINGQAGQLGQTNYSAAKAGIIGFTKALARESATKNITVNCISPGYTQTEMVEKMSMEVLEKIVSLIPMKRLGQPAEIARAAVFLCAEEAGFITGETLSINGGHNMF
ncbi:Acetoacetyl-CoA-like SDR family oxidoreductase [Candidatus Trichorickettsia mobilis]|uniref:Acetoacetyl-CoA-like SDR family oxidoreductase n=1 Tax=Candidatus Trichorickettsia mobilis TaxID=1346319 RepID=A0ABZ0UQY2_9RICK|nr:SDR family oxidoreductase [Candidatus Trichorickettsia mobilis]WPY00455.1 Acetoacetyl-CoA-like SDR family oxidoreductase [Candidatus Trichorickettsia mobilis]